MQRKTRSFLLRLLLCAFILAGTLLARDFVKPVAHPAKTYPAHDDHTDEKVAIGADPYDTAEKEKIFSVNFRDHGLLPVFFVVTNDGDQPVSIANMQVTFTTANHSKLTPVASQDIYRRLSNPQVRDNQNVPFPFPRGKVKGTISQKEMDEIQSSLFAARAVEPHATQSGFLFFDVEDLDAPLKGSSIFVTGVGNANGTELMYFEIPLEKYLNPGQAQ